MSLRSSILMSSLTALSLSLPFAGHAESKMKLKSKAKPAQSVAAPSSATSASGQTKATSTGPKRPMQNASISEYAFQPAPGYHAFSVQTVYVTRNLDLRYKKEGQFDVKDYENTKGMIVMTRYNRGLDNGWGVSAEIGTTVAPMDVEQKYEKSGRAKGLTDVMLMARNHKAVKMGELTYG